MQVIVDPSGALIELVLLLRSIRAARGEGGEEARELGQRPRRKVVDVERQGYGAIIVEWL